MLAEAGALAQWPCGLLTPQEESQLEGGQSVALGHAIPGLRAVLVSSMTIFMLSKNRYNVYVLYFK